MSESNGKILIVGAGPSGLTLATELTRRGIGCTIIDKAAGPAPMIESRALAFNARSQSILAASGVTEQIIAAGHMVDKIRLCWNGRLRNEVSMARLNVHTGTDAGLKFNRIVLIRQGSVERILINHLLSLNVHVRWNTECIDFQQNDSSVTYRLRAESGDIESGEASALIGCDGAHSQVRKQGGYSFDGESDAQSWTLVDATVSGLDVAHTLTADLRPGQAFATMPIEDNVVRLIHNGPDILKNHPNAQFCTDVHWESEFKVSYRMVKSFARGRTFLCGDAAHIHSPVGGRGMNLGIEDAATLAWLFSKGREKEYSNMRLPVAKKVLKLTQQQTTQMNSSSRVSSLVKQYAPKLISLPFIKRSMANSVLGLDTPYPAWQS